MVVGLILPLLGFQRKKMMSLYDMVALGVSEPSSWENRNVLIVDRHLTSRSVALKDAGLIKVGVKSGGRSMTFLNSFSTDLVSSASRFFALLESLMAFKEVQVGHSIFDCTSKISISN